MIITLTMNPAIDKTAVVNELVVGGLNRLEQVISNAGGKGINVSKAICALSGKSLAMGFIAGSNGKFITDTLTALDIAYDMVEVNGNTRVNLKVLNKNMELTELNEVGDDIREAQLQELIVKLLCSVKANDYVILSGSVPKGVPKDVYASLIHKIKEKGGKVILDADGALFVNGVKAIPTVIKPNVHELCEYFGVAETLDQDTLIHMGQQFLTVGVEQVVISMGKEGAIFLQGEEVAIAKGLQVKAHSSVGAGDAMVAGIAYALEKQTSFEEMIKIAMAASAGAVMSEGTNPAPKDVVEELMKQVAIIRRDRK